MGSKGEGLVRQQSAVQHATAVLLNKHVAPAALVLTYLPWLITASPNHALNVLKVCCLLPMPLSSPTVLVHVLSAAVADLHTQAGPVQSTDLIAVIGFLQQLAAVTFAVTTRAWHSGLSGNSKVVTKTETMVESYAQY